MSRSTDPRRRLAAATAALGLALAATGTSTAAADDARQPHTYPLVAHVYDLHATLRDPSGASNISTTNTALDATLHADVAFAKDSAELTPAATRAITQIATRLHSAKPGTLTITGYTDNLGTHAHGIELSTQRAQAVAHQLGTLTQLQVTVQGLAEADPVAPNTTEANRARNRRVEIHYTARS